MEFLYFHEDVAKRAQPMQHWNTILLSIPTNAMSYRCMWGFLQALECLVRQVLLFDIHGIEKKPTMVLGAA